MVVHRQVAHGLARVSASELGARNRPANATARRGLTDYLSALPADATAESSSSTPLSGAGLDFTSSDLSGLDLLGVVQR